MDMTNQIHRRSFLRRTGAAAAAPVLMGAAPKKPTVALVLDGSDPVAAARSVLKAAHELQVALSAAGFTVSRLQTPQTSAGFAIVGAGSNSPVAAGALAAAGVAQPKEPESLALFETATAGRRTIVATGADARGLTYALRELADRVRCGETLKFPTAVTEKPSNPVRSVMRQFVSETYDKPWFYDRAMWPQYLGMLADSRFNRFHLTFGLGEDMLKHVKDQYFLFTYPFLLAVPGYDVKVAGLSDAERDKNLATLRYISEETVAAGLDFELGLWMHGYEMLDTTDPKYVITGLNKQNHAQYCRDALTALLKALPAVSSVSLRIHGESGVAEGSYDFWKTIFDGVPAAGRKIEIDLHAKGIDDRMTENALATGMPVALAPKFSAEHMGLPYHQAEIRPTEIPDPKSVGNGLMTISEGQRSFTRYGYADLMRDDRKYTVRPRIFSGTQRILASGSAEAGAAYARAFLFCGMTGAEWMEPLTCRGRRGSAIASIARSGYAAARLQPKYDWQKYEYWYRTYGRTMYNPQSEADVFDRGFAKKPALKTALEAASRILPLVTNAYLPSAACDQYWPECYWNQPMSGEPNPNSYRDIPAPKVFQNTDALDPQLFLSCRGAAAELLGTRSGKYSPLEVADWLDGYADAAEQNLKAAGESKSVDDMRLAIDIQMQALLGHFFATRMRSGVLYALHEASNDAKALHESLENYYKARTLWARIVDRADGVYAADLSVSERFSERGQWRDWLALIDWDIFECERRRAAAKPSADPRVIAAVETALKPATREAPAASHTPPRSFTPKQEVKLEVAVQQPLAGAKLWYRHVTQAERWVSVPMTAAGSTYSAAIPAAYTDSVYPLQYYFELSAAADKAWIVPGLDAKQLNQPYVVLRRA
jgi:hypothetical protein